MIAQVLTVTGFDFLRCQQCSFACQEPRDKGSPESVSVFFAKSLKSYSVEYHISTIHSVPVLEKKSVFTTASSLTRFKAEGMEIDAMRRIIYVCTSQ